MKAVIKTIAYCIWFGFTLWLSFWFLVPAGWLEWKLLPTKTPAGVEFAVMVILWSGFVCLLALLPIWWMRKRRLEIAPQSITRNVTFVVLLLGCTTYCTIAWDNFVARKLYNCTDSIPFDFLRPGDWVHSHDGISVAVVPKINPSDPMDKPDTIKEGWSIPKLWLLWWAFVCASIAISASLAFLTFRSRKPKIAQTISP
jgi:hypothetical protein